MADAPKKPEVEGRERPRLRHHKPRKEPFLGIFIVGLGFFYGTIVVVLLLVALGVLKAQEITMEIEHADVISRIGFGSCHRQTKPAPILNTIVKADPDLFIFLGDNVYADTEDMDKMRAAYNSLLNQPAFQSLNDSAVLLATWDDHDYGRNDAGREFPARKASEGEFYRAWSVPADAPTRGREGVHSAYVFGPADKRVQVILLDTRYHRSPHRPNPKSDVATKGKWALQDTADATVLGATQWKWFEEQLRVPARLRIIGSSIQFLSSQHKYERWALFPRERQRFLKAIRKAEADGVLIISGDRHFAEMSVLPRAAPDGVGYPLYDVTSSSLNTPPPFALKKEPNPYRVSSSRYARANFGWIEIDWTAASPRIVLQIRDVEGQPVLQQEVSLGDLQPAPTPAPVN